METAMPRTTPKQNKALVLEASDTLFNSWAASMISSDWWRAAKARRPA
jgi:hypothetical protein